MIATKPTISSFGGARTSAAIAINSASGMTM